MLGVVGSTRKVEWEGIEREKGDGEGETDGKRGWEKGKGVGREKGGMGEGGKGVELVVGRGKCRD